MRRADFRLFRQLVSEVPRENVFCRCWGPSVLVLFKHHVIMRQDQAIPKCQNSSILGLAKSFLGNKAKKKKKERCMTSKVR